MTPEFLRASIEGDRLTAERHLDLCLPSDWPDIVDVLRLRLDQVEKEPELQQWLLRAMCHRETNAMVGYVGFHTAPGPAYLNDWLPGAVEFGFTVFSSSRRQGFATEASCALMRWAYTVHEVSKFVLTIAPNNAPAQRIAARIGFRRLGQHVDDVDGIEDVLAFEYE